jgi:hypothetical protein
MKKALFALAFLCEISSGMNHRDTYRSITDQFGKYSDLYDKWRVEFSGYENFEKRGTPESTKLEMERDAAKPQKFDPAILDAAIRQDIGSDETALQALLLFSECKLHELIDFYPEASTKMLPINSERFKEIFLLLAPILNVQSRRMKKLTYTCPEKYKEYKDKIISIWGGDPKVITFKAIKYPQFCFEMFLRQVLKLEDLRNGVLFQAVMCMAEEFIGPEHDWDGRDGELSLYCCSTGSYEDCGGQCSPKDVWRNWRESDISDW